MRTNPLEFELKSAILGTGMIQPVGSGYEKGKNCRIWALCRQLPGREKLWLQVVQQLLEAVEGSDVDVHIGRRYLLRDKRLVFGWYLGVSGPTRRVQKTMTGLIEILSNIQAPLNDAYAGSPQDVPGDDEEPEDVPQAPPRRRRAGERPPPQVRPPGEAAHVDEAPEGFVPRIRVIRNSTDPETGRRIVEEEMPLPHVYKEMNKPTHKFGRGAKMTGANEPARRR